MDQYFADWRGFEDNPKPGQQLPRDNGEPGGGNMFWIRHTGGEVALYAHFRKGTVPTALCPTNGLQNGTINVSKGQFLGRAGNSGSSGAPHLHFHIQDSWTDNPLDKGQSVPALFNNIEVDDRPDNQSFSWNDVNGRTFTSQSDTSSASGRTLIKIDN